MRVRTPFKAPGTQSKTVCPDTELLNRCANPILLNTVWENNISTTPTTHSRHFSILSRQFIPWKNDKSSAEYTEFVKLSNHSLTTTVLMILIYKVRHFIDYNLYYGGCRPQTPACAWKLKRRMAPKRNTKWPPQLQFTCHVATQTPPTLDNMWHAQKRR